ncbi:MAG TPA: hypothetical protein VII62_15740, partial [Vicinamibacteria bacterium]
MQRMTLASLLALFVGPCVVTACVGRSQAGASESQAVAGESLGPAPIPASGEALAVSDDIVKRK